MPERSRKNFEVIFIDDFQKISRFFLCEILNDLFWPVTKVPERSIQSVPADLTISTGTRVQAKYQVPVWYENLSGVVICPDNSNININGVVIGSRDQ